jgi:hypothetical protein
VKGSGRGPGSCLDVERKTTKTLSQDSLDLNPGPPEYEAGVPTTRPQRSVRTVQKRMEQNRLEHNMTG